ncbi:MAG: Hsp70 family protein [Deltaproteobacteria bacterium]|jgi:molecular chaperone DnaK|nr:Hsp70 family protein [Deltaproteobacteria bacterium]
MTEKIYGIDLGTTNSCLAVLDGNPRIIPIDDNGIVPSVVSFDDANIIVGRRALNRSLAYPEQSARSIKRLMGTNEEIKINKKSYQPEEISSMILDYLRQEAKRIEGVDVKRVVITVPAYFSEAQRRATMKAGQLAGLTVERIINEPTAAALFYDLISVGSQESPWKFALVYDLGGGTFDVSVLRMEGIIEVLASTGDTHLGGDDFDERLTQLFLRTIKEERGEDLSQHRPALARLNSVAEKAKIELSTRGVTRVEESAISGPGRGNFSLEMELTRGQFESLTEDLVDNSLKFVHQALNEAGLKPQDIDRVLLVGGMSRMPIVAEKLSAIFGKAQLPVVDPDLSVAKGAAVQGGLITGENVDQVLIDVTAHSLSLMADNANHIAECVPIIPRNTPIPSTRSQLFSSVGGFQKMGLLAVFQGESTKPRENEFIGYTPFYLKEVSERTPIEVEFSYDINGMIHVIAEQKGHKRRLEVDLDSRNPFTDENGPKVIDDWSALTKAWVQSGLNDDDDDDDDDDRDDHNEDNADDQTRNESDPIQWNFVLKRARVLIESMEPGEKLDQLTKLVTRYSQALKDDADEVDELEDEILSFMETLE